MNLMKSTISIVVPVYNVEKYVLVCIKSILSQIEKEDELIIINDGSEDGSLEICQDFTKDHDNVVIYSQKNRGLSVARNKGIELSKNEYVMFVDADDYLIEGAIRKIRICVEKYNLDILQFDAEILNQLEVESKRNPYDRRYFPINDVLTGKEMFRESFPRYYQPSSCLMAIKRDFLINGKHRFIEGILHEDNAFTFQVLMNAQRVKHMPEKLYIRRMRRNSITTGGWSSVRWNGLIYAIEVPLEYLNINIDVLSRNLVMKILFLYWSMVKVLIMGRKEMGSTEDVDIWKFNEDMCSFLKMWKKNVPYMHSIPELRMTLDIKKELDAMDYLDSKIREEFLSIDLSNLEELSKQSKRVILQSIPFSRPEIRLGIFGLGKHTKCLLQDYQELIGEIRCEYMFFDSFIDAVGEYMEKPVYNIKEAKGKVDMILISSYIYSDEMNAMVDSVLGSRFERIQLYNCSDIGGAFY